MQSILNQWFDHYRGALYPINLTECRKSGFRKHEVKSLLRIAADFIVKDATSTMEAVHVLPIDLSTVLMQQALEGNRDRAVNILLTKWPYPALLLKRFAPDIFTHLGQLHDKKTMTKAAKQGLAYTTCLAHNFLESLKHKCPTNLKCLDMTGYPTAEVITYYLSTHCMLAYNEARQSKLINRYEEAIKLLPDAAAPSVLDQFTCDTSIPDDTFRVKMDVFLTSDHVHAELCKALKVSSFNGCRLQLIVEKLDALSLGTQKVAILLEQLDPQHLKGLRLQYNMLNGTDFRLLAPVIVRFEHLTALDLSCSGINIYQNDSACDEMANLLGSLLNLVRLDLSNNRLKTKLRRVLSPIRKTLQYLRLAACGLSLADLTYLSMSSHVSTLTELDISENALGVNLSVCLRLLKNIQSHICVLEMEDCGIGDEQFLTLLDSSVMQRMHSLLYLNIAGNRLSRTTIQRIGDTVADLYGLQYILIAFPVECYMIEASDEQEQAKAASIMELQRVIREQRSRKGGPSDLPCIVCKELDVEMEVNQ